MSVILTAGKRGALTLFRASIQSGEPVIFPTDTIYGIGAPITSIAANKRIYGIKKRPLDQPMPILIGNFEQLSFLATGINSDAFAWLKNVWTTSNPERYTVVLKAVPWLDAFYTKNGAVAIRLAALTWLAEAIVSLGAPVTATSVNFSGTPSLNNPNEIVDTFLPYCKYMLWGEVGSKQASAIVDLTNGNPKIVRA